MSAHKRQIARLTPSQLIELSYLSALLERCPKGFLQLKMPSEKFRVAEKFFIEVSQVVPVESFLYAVHGKNKDVARPCFEALCTKLKISPSSLMISSVKSPSRLSAADGTNTSLVSRNSNHGGFPGNRLCGLDIRSLYPMKDSQSDIIQSLKSTKRRLYDLSCTAKTKSSDMLNAIVETYSDHLTLLKTILGNYMEDMRIKIPFEDVRHIRELAEQKRRSLSHEGILVDESDVNIHRNDNSHTAEIKLSYLLELVIVNICEKKKIEEYPLEFLERNLEKILEKSPLSLAADSSRPLIARWVKWVLLINSLRDDVTRFKTTIGVVGLVNSGMTKLVNSLFKIQVSEWLVF